MEMVDRAQKRKGIERWIACLLVITVVCVPFSVKLYGRAIDLEVIFPAEPLIAVAALLGLVKRVGRGTGSLRKWMRSPIVVCVLLLCTALAVSMLFSDAPLVSMKALVVKCVYVFVFFYMMLDLPLTGRWSMWSLLLCHALAVFPVMLYSFAGQLEGGLDRASAGFVSYPFYVDHTIFSAALVFAACTFGGGVHGSAQAGWGNGRAVFWSTLMATVLIAVLLAYSRGAWLSVAVAVGGALVLLAWHHGLPRAFIGVVGLVGVVVAAMVVVLAGTYRSPVSSSLHRSGLGATLASMTNTTTDPSNRERLNRWGCAWRMFKDHPITGTGIGTFQFRFLAYQQPDERSPISMPDSADVRHLADHLAGGNRFVVRPRSVDMQYSGGSAHNEYLLALSESGMLAGSALCALVLAALYTGWRAIRYVNPGYEGSVVFAATIGVLAYGVHGCFNNFLDDCKIALPFWLSLAVLARAGLGKCSAASRSVGG